AAEADVDAVAETLTLAFRADPVWGRYAFPDPERQVEQSRRLWAAYARAAMRFPWRLVTPGCEAGAVWIPPNEPELSEDHAGEARCAANAVAQLVRVAGRDEHRPLVPLDRLDQPADSRHHHRQPVAQGEMQRPALGRAPVGQCDEVGTAEVAVGLIVADVPVDERDAVAVAALRDKPGRQVPLLPRLADDGEPVAGGLILGEPVEGADQVL